MNGWMDELKDGQFNLHLKSKQDKVEIWLLTVEDEGKDGQLFSRWSETSLALWLVPWACQSSLWSQVWPPFMLCDWQELLPIRVKNTHTRRHWHHLSWVSQQLLSPRRSCPGSSSVLIAMMLWTNLNTLMVAMETPSGSIRFIFSYILQRNEKKWLTRPDKQQIFSVETKGELVLHRWHLATFYCKV